MVYFGGNIQCNAHVDAFKGTTSASIWSDSSTRRAIAGAGTAKYDFSQHRLFVSTSWLCPKGQHYVFTGFYNFDYYATDDPTGLYGGVLRAGTITPHTTAKITC